MKYNKYYVYALFTMTLICLTVSDNLHSNNQKEYIIFQLGEKNLVENPQTSLLLSCRHWREAELLDLTDLFNCFKYIPGIFKGERWNWTRSRCLF